MYSKIIHLLSILMAFMVSTSCDYEGRVSIEGTNKSDEDVWFSHFSPNLTGPPIWGEDRVYYDKTEFFFVKRHSSSLIFDTPTKNGWGWIERHEYPDSLHIRVWSDDLIRQVGWEEFVQNMETKYKYELEYILDINDLEKIDYRVTYPPSGIIEHMRVVYPE